MTMSDETHPDGKRGQSFNERAEALHAKSLVAMRGSVESIEDPVKQQAARDIIKQMEEAGRRYREDRVREERDSRPVERAEADRVREMDVQRQAQHREARDIAQDAANREAAQRQADADRSTARAIEQADLRQPRDRGMDREDDR